MSVPLDPGAVPRLVRGVRLRHDETRGAWVLLAPERVLHPDPVAIEILQRVDGSTSLSGIVDDLVRVFAADRDRIDEDVRTFLAGLVEKGFLEFS